MNILTRERHSFVNGALSCVDVVVFGAFERICVGRSLELVAIHIFHPIFTIF
jgi:hypothetical protein